MARLFLGLDASTQSISALVIDYDSREIVYEASLGFDEALPSYGTRNGTLRSEDPRVVHSPPMMWVEALDLVFHKLVYNGVDLGSVLAVSGSGQQHGSVYLKSEAVDVLANLDPGRTLAENLSGVFSRETSPIWMDSSTTAECREIMRALGGPAATAEATGSAAFERFTGPQIRKFFKTDPEAYADTAQIALVSSFMASLMAGRIAPIDHGDGAGMNLMDIGSKEWNADALKATAPNLRQRLPGLAPSATVIGPVSGYFARRYGLNPEAQAIAWSGDNPNSVIGVGLVKPGMVAISLGTSDTYFGFMKECHTDPHGEGHVFGAPTGDYMTLICFKNGSLARENVRDAYGLDWNGFSEALRATSPGNNGGIMLPWFEPEIVPKVLKPGVRRFDLDEADAAANCRAVVEAQMMSMRIHSRWMGVRPTRIYATGGASENPEILRVMADVQKCPVYRFEVSNSAALGAALRAAQAYLAEAGEAAGWEEVVAGFAEPAEGSRIEPDAEAAAIYDRLVGDYAAREKEAASR
jgi:xylulokinase